MHPGFNTYRAAMIKGHVAGSGIIGDLLRGNKAGLKRRVGVMQGTETPTLSETKRTLRENPYLRGYGFSEALREHLIEFAVLAHGSGLYDPLNRTQPLTPAQALPKHQHPNPHSNQGIDHGPH